MSTSGWRAYALSPWLVLIGVPFAILCFLTDPIYPVMGLVVLAYIVATFVNPIVGLFGVVAFIVSPFSYSMSRVEAGVIVASLVAISCASAAVRLPLRRASRRRLTMEVIAVVYVTYMLFNCAVAIWHGHVYKYALSELMPVLEISVCYWCASRLEWNSKMVRVLLLGTLLITSVRAIWELSLFFSGRINALIAPIYDTLGETGYHFAGQMVVVRLVDLVIPLQLPIALGVFIVSKSRAVRAIALSTLGVATAVAILGMYRSVWIGAFVSCLFVFFYLRKRMPRVYTKAVLGGLCIFASFLVLSHYLGKKSVDLASLVSRRASYTVQQMHAGMGTEESLRMMEYRTAWREFVRAPVFGLGLGSDVGDVVLVEKDIYKFQVMHNCYLNYLVNSGAVGMILLILLIATGISTFNRLYRTSTSAWNSGVLIISMAGLVWFAVILFFQPIYAAYNIPALLGIFLGMSMSLNRADLGRVDKKRLASSGVLGTNQRMHSDYPHRNVRTGDNRPGRSVRLQGSK